MSKALIGSKGEAAAKFYEELLSVLIKEKCPFMIGGTFAFTEYTGIERPTGDMDIKIPYDEYPEVLKALADAGFKPELASIEFIWLAKVIHKKGFYTDFIFAERNGLYKIDASWLERARPGTVLGNKVLLEPVEEMIRSKCYVRNRYRDDGGDVVHLILRQGKTIDWRILLKRMEPHWELLFSTILLFLFIYPSEREIIPVWVIDTLIENLKKRVNHPLTNEKITRGLLLSEEYQVSVSQWGFKPIKELK